MDSGEQGMPLAWHGKEHDTRGSVTYTHRSRIGFGGFSDVYAGEWRHVPPNGHRDATLAVAVKLIKDTNVPQKIVRRLNKEIKIWSSLEHPHLLALCGTCQWTFGHHTQIHIVTPLLKEGNLSQYIRRNPRADRLRLLAQVADALSYLHTPADAKGVIIHGDIKAENVLISDAGDAILADFGLATVADEIAATTSTSFARAGTERFKAPELLLDEIPKRTRESDVYAFSMLVYQLYAGHPPFPEHSSFRFYQAIQAGARPPRPKGCSDTMWTMMTRCWAQDAGTRPSMSEVFQIFKLSSKVPLISTLRRVDTMNLDCHVSSLAFSPDGRRLAVSAVSGEAAILSQVVIRHGQYSFQQEISLAVSMPLVWSTDGQSVITIQDGVVTIYETNGRKRRSKMLQHDWSVEELSSCPPLWFGSREELIYVTTGSIARRRLSHEMMRFVIPFRSVGQITKLHDVEKLLVLNNEAETGSRISVYNLTSDEIEKQANRIPSLLTDARRFRTRDIKHGPGSSVHCSTFGRALVHHHGFFGPRGTLMKDRQNCLSVWSVEATGWADQIIVPAHLISACFGGYDDEFVLCVTGEAPHLWQRCWIEVWDRQLAIRLSRLEAPRDTALVEWMPGSVGLSFVTGTRDGSVTLWQAQEANLGSSETRI